MPPCKLYVAAFLCDEDVRSCPLNIFNSERKVFDPSLLFFFDNAGLYASQINIEFVV